MSNTELRAGIPILASLDLPTTIRFYTEKLGFRCIFNSDGEYAIVHRDNVEIHFWLCNDPNIAANTACRIAVSGIDTLFEEYSQAGALRPDCAVREKPWRAREFEVFDPHGNLITFSEAGGATE